MYQNKALLLKQLHKIYSKANVPWINLVWSLYGNRVPHAQSRRGSFGGGTCPAWWVSTEALHAVKCRVVPLFFFEFFLSNEELMCDKYP
jgi:hypothetical protein